MRKREAEAEALPGKPGTHNPMTNPTSLLAERERLIARNIAVPDARN